MVDVRSKRCSHHGCAKQPHYGAISSMRAEFCSEHKKDGMVGIVNRSCSYDACNTIPIFGVVGGTKRAELFCSAHKKDGMVDVKNKPCSHPGCKAQAVRDVEGTKKFCSRHNKARVANVVSRSCGHPGCTTRPSYGIAGSGARTFCSRHAKDNMLNLNGSKRRARDDGKVSVGPRRRGPAEAHNGTARSSGAEADNGTGCPRGAAAEHRRSRSHSSGGQRDASSSSSRRGSKRARAPAGIPVAPNTAVDERSTSLAEDDSFLGLEDYVAVKTEVVVSSTVDRAGARLAETAKASDKPSSCQEAASRPEPYAAVPEVVISFAWK
ncbi:unnamed protein product [Ectocarpus sp. 6 AP-2014]